MRTRLVEGLPSVLGDRVQLQQVILKLIVNALEAIHGVGDGPRERLFEALFTTKPGGLGMGFAICRSIVGAHAGHLWAEANAARGAVFRLSVPVEGKMPENPEVESSSQAPSRRDAPPAGQPEI